MHFGARIGAPVLDPRRRANVTCVCFRRTRKAPAPHSNPLAPDSAREDAIKRTPQSSGRSATLALAAFAGAALGLVVALVFAPSSLALFRARAPWTGAPPTAAEWPEPARPGESVDLVIEDGHVELQVLAPRLPQARRLATDLASRRASGQVALAHTRVELERRWRQRVLPAPLPPFTPAAECASLLRAEAIRRRDLANALPAPFASPGHGAAEAFASVPDPDDAARAATDALAVFLAASDAEGSRRALIALSAADAAQFARGVPSADASAASRGASWRRAQRVRADSLDALAERTLAGETPFQRELAASGAAERVVMLADASGDPYAPLAANVAVPKVAAGPLAEPWAVLVLLGGGLGALVGLFSALLGFEARRRVPLEASPLVEPARDPAETTPWLHVVAGPSPVAAARATLELAAHALARRERVLVVDAGTRLLLHERLGRDARWGLMECLQGDMPVLGLVQYGGRPGFYVLAHGHAASTNAWAGLGRCLDDARLHFGRVIIAIDRGTPREFGEALAGRPLEGWWAAPAGRLPVGAAELSGRHGIAFSGIDLTAWPDVSLEVLSRRVAELITLHPPAPEPPLATYLEPEPVPVPEPRQEPDVLDCDLQVQQRLRFLAWMRRVQSESRRPLVRTTP